MTPPIDPAVPDEPKYHSCNVCGKDAVACFSPDIDIKGLCYCGPHKIEVMMVYSLVIRGNDQEALKLMKDWKQS